MTGKVVRDHVIVIRLKHVQARVFRTEVAIKLNERVKVTI
jgi:hypothetical protein